MVGLALLGTVGAQIVYFRMLPRHGAGKVTMAGYNGGYGIYVRLEHTKEIGTEDEVFEVSESRAIVDMWRSRVLTCPDPPTEERRERALVTTWRCGEQFIRFTVIDGMGHLWPTYPWFDADDEILRIARGEIPPG